MELGINDDRKIINQLASILRYRKDKDVLLLGAAAKDWTKIYHLSRRLALLAPSAPHHLRHGGASADAIAKFTDLELMARGSWQSQKGILCYRHTGNYLRKLDLLNAGQLAQARSATSTILLLVRQALN